MIFGRRGPGTLTGFFDLANADVTFEGVANSDGLGSALSLDGDINDDGYDDILISASLADPNGMGQAGETYLIQGFDFDPNDPPDRVEVTDAASAIFVGLNPNDQSGTVVTTSGDLDGDGENDIVISAPNADPNGVLDAGAVYVFAGQDDPEPYDGIFDLDDADLTIVGAEAFDKAGTAVSFNDDMGGSGYGGLLITAPGATGMADPNSPLADAGAAYLILGDSSPGGSSSAEIVDDIAFVTMFGNNPGDQIGNSASILGDINRDGIQDILIGAPNADPNGMVDAGETYFVDPDDAGAPGSVDSVGAFANATFIGKNGSDFSGAFSTTAGDFNADGIEDVLIGALAASPGGIPAAGEVYLIYGKDPDDPNDPNAFNGIFDLANADVIFTGIHTAGLAASLFSAGDFNGDNIDDIVISSPNANPGGAPGAGITFLFYGRAAFLQGDINQDGVVDIADLGLIGGRWGTDGMGDPNDPFDFNADLNGDGTVDVADLGIVGGEWGQTSGGPSLTSAPATIPAPRPSPLASPCSGPWPHADAARNSTSVILTRIADFVQVSLKVGDSV